jgi:hypothetical protein
LTNSPTYSSTTGGGSFNFNGTSQFASVTPALLNTTYTGKTVFVVCRMSSAGWTPGVAQYRAMFGTGTGTRNFNFYVYHTAANTYQLHFSVSGSATITTDVAIVPDTWMILAVTQDTTVTYYVNGVSVYSAAGQTLSQYAAGGNEAVARADNYWSGDIAVCSIYSRTLSSAEILNNYNAFASRVGLATSTISNRQNSDGTLSVNTQFDEFTGAPVVDSSLTMWLDFGQTASYSGSGATVTDLSPTRTANVTLTGSPTFSSTDGGGSETFNGTSQYGTGSGAPLGSSAYTKSFWFQLSSYGVNNNVVSGATGQHFSYFGGGTRLLNGHSFWGNFGAFSSVTTFSLNTWYHAVVTFNTATGMALYVNGALDSTYVSTSGTSRTDTALTGNGQVDIAQFGGGNLLSGKIGQVMIYNRALTADEVATNFNALRGRYGI